MKNTKIKNIMIFNIVFEIMLPLMGFFYLGNIGFNDPHWIIFGQFISVAFAVSVIVSMFFYIPVVIIKNISTFPSKLSSALYVVISSVVLEVLIVTLSGSDINNWFMISGVHFFAILLISNLIVVNLLNKKKIFTNTILVKLFTFAGIISVILSQIVILPVYISNNNSFISFILLLFWFIVIFIKIKQNILLDDVDIKKFKKEYLNFYSKGYYS